MTTRRLLNLLLLAALLAPAPLPAASSTGEMDRFWVPVAAPGTRELRVLSPTVLELALVQAKAPDPARLARWDFVDATGAANIPAPARFRVTVDEQPVAVAGVGLRRRSTYAPLTGRDLRVGTSLYLHLGTPIRDGQVVRVQNPDASLWPADWAWSTPADPLRTSPAIHVSHAGYQTALPKLAMVGGYLGSLGELLIDARTFQLVDARTGAVVHEGTLRPRADAGFAAPLYRQVFEADFSAFRTPGEYRLKVAGLGASLPFLVHDGAGAALARTTALGLYHLRCGTDNALPYTRFVHDACHIAPAAVPAGLDAFRPTWTMIANATAGANPDNPAQTAPRLVSPETQLYPFVNTGPVDVAGGHHDAGDYSKYTINSAGLVHLLVFAVDSLPGVAALDNLGLPESGDGVGDVLQEARHEAEFLAKMQDADGGFYFLVYPRNRAYENDVLPERGDAQVVWPKNTAATAAAVAALAQTASSPRFREAFPADAARYLERAQLGWRFLTDAIAKHGKAGAYQRLTHYGDYFTHDDELAWAATELFLATGDPVYHDKLREWFNPASPDTWRWSWWHLFDSYGNAVRSYAFAARSGRLAAGALDAAFLAKCEAELVTGARDQLRWAEASAYGTSFPEPTKRVRGGGWYFSTDAAYDLAVALQLNGPAMEALQPRALAALVSNLNYATGANPAGVSYITGLGWNRPREVVSQYAVNDRRSLPPTGLLVGNIQANFSWVGLYGAELGGVSFPSDGHPTQPYPFYDRWSDAFNVTTESVVTNQARALGVTAWLMAQTPLKDQPWTPRAAAPAARIVGAPPAGAPTGTKVTLSFALDPANPLLGRVDDVGALLLWEGTGHAPGPAERLEFAPDDTRPRWAEAELLWRDGRRVFAAAEFALALPPLLPEDAADAGSGPPGQITAFSARAHAGPDAQTLTLGFYVAGFDKPLLIRGVGPGLQAAGLSGTLPDPRLTVYRDDTVISSNDDWASAPGAPQVAATAERFGLTPAAAQDAAVLTGFNQAAYTALVSNPNRAHGIALIEVYDTRPGATARLTAMSARAQVNDGADVLIAGFILAGERPATLLIRGIGPGLAAFGVGGVLADPHLRLFAEGQLLVENDNWGDAPNPRLLIDAAIRTGDFPLAAGSRDAALVTTLRPGGYTVHVSGANHTTGVALVEIYELR